MGLIENKIKYCFIPFWLLCLPVFGQNIIQYTYHDSGHNQLKEIYHVRDTVSNILEGKYMSYFMNGNLESQGQFYNNETVGVWEFYYENKTLKMKGELKDNSNFGHWEYFYENGNKSMEGEISNKKRNGEWRFYYEAGELESIGGFEDGKRQGKWRDYYEDNQLKGEIDYLADTGVYTGYYRSGKRKSTGVKRSGLNDGNWEYFYENGAMKATGQFHHGKRQNTWQYFHENKKTSAQGDFEDGKQVGEWEFYYEDGTLNNKGRFSQGNKDGTWQLYYPSGELKGKGLYENGNGGYEEYYENGKLKLKGFIVKGKNQGKWQYYYDSGELEGECNFNNGEGSYIGYYPGGAVKSKGKIKDDERIGVWELYKGNGELTGYYRPFYESEPKWLSEPDVDTKVLIVENPKKQGVADYRFKGKKFKYFDAKVNEFQGLIVSANPLGVLAGTWPLSLELYFQERLGYEFEFQVKRAPFFKEDKNIPLEDPYLRGYSAAVKQKFYNPDYMIGMWYFGHELMYSKLAHQSNLRVDGVPNELITVSASEQKVEYLLSLGYRLMPRTSEKGFTMDFHWGFGIGVRDFNVSENNQPFFKDLPQAQVSFPFKLGLNFGFAFDNRRKKR